MLKKVLSLLTKHPISLYKFLEQPFYALNFEVLNYFVDSNSLLSDVDIQSQQFDICCKASKDPSLGKSHST